MIRHILLITFKPDASAEQISAVQQQFLTMTSRVEGVEAVEWGENDSPEGKNQGYSHAVLMTFRDEAARQRYLPHPEHDQLKTVFRPVLQDIVVLDYTVSQ